jgi:hypothetical protein
MGVGGFLVCHTLFVTCGNMGGQVRYMCEMGVGSGSCYAWNRCPNYGLPKVVRDPDEVCGGVNIFRPVAALIGSENSAYFHGTGQVP